MGTNAAAPAGTSFASGALIGGGSGFASSFINGFGNAVLNGKSFSESLKQGAVGGGIGLVSGALFTGVIDGINALKDGRKFWNGARLIEENTLANKNLPPVAQKGKYNCAAAATESTTGIPQERIRSIVGGHPDREPITILQLEIAIESETGRLTRATSAILPTATDLNGANQIAGYLNMGQNFLLGSKSFGESIGHMTALNSVQVQTFQKINGDLYYRVIYQVMDTAGDVFRNINANSVLGWLRF